MTCLQEYHLNSRRIFQVCVCVGVYSTAVNISVNAMPLVSKVYKKFKFNLYVNDLCSAKIFIMN